MMTPEAAQRYRRQMMLPAIGSEGQMMLGRARVAVVGCGGLGSVLSQIMVRMGVWRVTVIDGDRPDITNLHRQILFDETDVAAGTISDASQPIFPTAPVAVACLQATEAAKLLLKKTEVLSDLITMDL